MRRLLSNACSGLTNLKQNMLMQFRSSNLPVTKEMLPKLIGLVKSCHASGNMANRWCLLLQQAIENHYMTEGNCLFFDDAEVLLSGEKDYDMTALNLYIKKMQGLNLQ
jgi:hypothetical protein